MMWMICPRQHPCLRQQQVYEPLLLIMGAAASTVKDDDDDVFVRTVLQRQRVDYWLAQQHAWITQRNTFC